MSTLDIASDSTLQATNAALQEIATAISGSGGGGSSTLAGLSDTTITNPENGQVLKYSSSTGRWVNVADGSYVTTNKVLATLSACVQNTDTSRVAGATALKELNTKVSNISGGGSRRTRKNITSSLSKLSTAISEQDLEKYDYSIGDFFVGNSGYYYHIADMDTFYSTYGLGATVNKHHVAMVVDTKVNTQWMDSNFTEWGFDRSNYRSYLTGLVASNIRSDFNTLFGGYSDHLIAHNNLITNSVGNKTATWTWVVNQVITAITEAQIYGSRQLSNDDKEQGEGFKQLELFRKFCFNEIFGNTDIWLRSVASETFACFANYLGSPDAGTASMNKRAAGVILFK